MQKKVANQLSPYFSVVNSEIKIRKAEISDAGIIYQFINELEDTVFDKALFDKYYAENLHPQNNYYLVAVIDDAVVGFISCHRQILLHHSGMVYQIQELFVDKQYRSMGIGAKLITELKEILSKENYKLLEVACNLKRKDAHLFYLANGFGQTHYKFTKENKELNNT